MANIARAKKMDPMQGGLAFKNANRLALGFSHALLLRLESWFEIADDDYNDVATALSILSGLSSAGEAEIGLPKEEFKELLYQAPNMIPYSVQRLRDWRLCATNNLYEQQSKKTDVISRVLVAQEKSTRNAATLTDRNVLTGRLPKYRLFSSKYGFTKPAAPPAGRNRIISRNYQVGSS